jgi:uncharacterized protein YukE
VSDNGLIADAYHSPTSSTKGFGLFDAADDMVAAIDSKSWMDNALAGAGATFEVLSYLDPIGTLASSGVSWILEQCQWTNDLLHELSGDADALLTHAGTWTNMADEAWAMVSEMQSLMESSTEEWTGKAADAFRDLHTSFLTALDGMGWVFDGMRAATEGAATLAQITYELIRDVIAELVSLLLIHIPIWLGLIAASAGVATPLCIIDAIGIIAGFAGLAFSLVTAAVQSIMAFHTILTA